MEHANILDSEEQGHSFLYGNRSLYCLGASLFFLWITALALDYIEENNFSRTLGGILIMSPFGVSLIIALGGCYWGIKGIRFKENKRWRTSVGFLGNLLCVLLIGLTLMIAFMPAQIAPEMIPIPE
ncbi:MAG: hypothetical protein JKY03_12165 [Aureispira sp.]|nr:hypothetical protein [Aureispira sp.]